MMEASQSYICEVCQIDVGLYNKESHENGRKHKKKLMHADGAQKNTSTSTCKNYPNTVCVTGYPAYAQKEDIIRAFAKFEPIKLQKMTKRFALVTFSSEQAWKAAISNRQEIFIYGKYINVINFTPEVALAMNPKPPPKREFPKTKQKEAIIEPQSIDLSGDFDQQVEAILAAIRLTRDQAEHLSLLYSNLTEVFQYLWPGCVAVPFGSITTGLGIKSSDADCFIDIPESIRRNPGSFHTFVPKARNILSRYPKIFSEVLAIPRANTPIVKFFHIPTNTNCDVSFKTPLGARNSAFIAFVLKIDKRILYLCILLKYWGKVHSLTGTGKLSNYALTMLVIFYLQQQPSPMLPCVQFLQRGLTFMIDHWNTAFNDQYHLLPPIMNNSSLCELLGGFFKFYAGFNFTEDIVCPYLGIPVKKAFFRKTEDVSDAFEIYKSNVKSGVAIPIRVNADTMCIQDPFELSRNISSCVGFKLSSEIQQSIQWAASIYEKEITNNGEADFLRNILLNKPTIRTVNSNPKFKIVINANVLQALPQEEWINMVIEAFVKIFKDILKFSVKKVEPKEENTKNSKNKANIKMHNEIFLCKASQLVWRRKQFSKMYDAMKMDFFTKQLKITKEVIKFGDGKINVPMHLLVDLMLFDNPRKCSLSLRWENDEYCYFEEFGHFCLGNIRQWFVELFKVDKSRKPNMKESSAETSDCQTKNTTDTRTVRTEQNSMATSDVDNAVQSTPHTTPLLDITSDSMTMQSKTTINVDPTLQTETITCVDPTLQSDNSVNPLQSVTVESVHKVESMLVDTPDTLGEIILSSTSSMETPTSYEERAQIPTHENPPTKIFKKES